MLIYKKWMNYYSIGMEHGLCVPDPVLLFGRSRASRCTIDWDAMTYFFGWLGVNHYFSAWDSHNLCTNNIQCQQ